MERGFARNTLSTKIFTKSLVQKPFSKNCEVILNPTVEPLFPDVAILPEPVLISLISSVPSEKRFSCHNHLKTKHQASLSKNTLVMLMSIWLEGPKLEDLDARRAAVLFCSAKSKEKMLQLYYNYVYLI